MPYVARNVDGVSILDLEGEIDLYKSPEVRAEIGKLINKKSKSVVVNFEKVSYIDSSGLAKRAGALSSWMSAPALKEPLTP